MAIIEGGGENDLSQLWALITELSEQLNKNRSMSVSLYGLAGKIKTESLNSQTGFVLRRHNMDKTKEEYETQLEGMNAAMTQDNLSLQHDNKQLNGLIKEYEQTLETLMSAFRNRAQDIQERELKLIREFEAKLIAREEEIAARELLQTSSVSNSLARLSHLLRQLLRAHEGEPTQPPPPLPPIPPFIPEFDDKPEESSQDEPEATQPEESVQDPLISIPQSHTEESSVELSSEDALERDTELARLQRENEELRRLIGLLPPHPRKEPHHIDFRPIFEVNHPTRLPSMQRQMSAGNIHHGGGGGVGSNMAISHAMSVGVDGPGHGGSDQQTNPRLGMRLFG